MPGKPSRAARKQKRADAAIEAKTGIAPGSGAPDSPAAARAAAAAKRRRPAAKPAVAKPVEPLFPPRADGLPHVIAVFGPTASGKTAVAEAIAAAAGGEVVSCDSMQCYAGVPILTNQPEKPTHLVGFWPLEHSGSVGEYQALAHEAIDEIVGAGRIAVVAGGTGLYLRAALAELHLPPAPRPGLREEMEKLVADLGPERAHALLAERDPDAAAGLHPNDTRRVVRALELHSVGKTLTPDRDRLWSKTYRLPSVVFGLEVDRDELAHRIVERTEQMWERGGPDEARAALALGEMSEQARQMIGLSESEQGLDHDEWVESVAVRTRQYARRQRTWMRKIPSLITLEGARPAAVIADEALQVARTR